VSKLKRIILALGSGLLFYALMFLASTMVGVRGQVLPVTAPVTPPGTATPTPTSGPTATPTITPTPSHSEGKTTGGVAANWGSTLMKVNLNVHSGTWLKGQVKYSDNTGKMFNGDVTKCYFQTGKESVFVGTVKDGNVPEEYFLVKVLDNGEGKKSEPDMLGVWLTDVEPLCTTGGYPATVTQGNLQVHK
jgi:hypothetical protein